MHNTSTRSKKKSNSLDDSGLKTFCVDLESFIQRKHVHSEPGQTDHLG